MNLSQKSQEITESLTLAISAKANKMKAEGKDVVGFGAGEPDFDTPEYIMDAAREALDEGFTNYTPATGTEALRKEICNKLARDNDLNYEPDQVVVTNGAKHSLYNVFQAILNPEDEVIISAPYWVSYPEMVKMGSGTPVFVETGEENGFKMTPADIKNNISSKTKALLLNSPSNPTGAVYQKEDLQEIAEIAVENEILVISDEVYEHLIYDGLEHVSIASLSSEIKDLTIVINAMSKAYAMTGWRIGYTAGIPEVIDVMGNIQSHSTSNPNSIAQYASTVGLKNTEKAKKAMDKMVKAFSSRRDYMTEKINSIPGLSCKNPHGAFYIMLNFKDIIGKKYQGKQIEGSLTFADILLEAKQVAVVPGIAFGSDHHVRLSYANSLDNIKKGLSRIEKFVEKLN